MAEIQCPKCGKNNPAGRDTCQYCQAFLNAQPFPAGGDSDVPDWLSSLRGDDQDELSGIGGNQEDAGDVPDWLSRLGGAEEAPQPDLFAAGSGEQATPDWLSGAQSAGDVPDWLSGAGQEAAQPFAGEDIPDFSLESSAEPAAALPDWLSGAAAPEPAQESGGDPDWLEKVRARQQAEQAPGNPAFFETEGADSQAPDWLSDSAAQSEIPEQSPAGAFDWLGGGTADSSMQQASPFSTPIDEGGSGSFDWTSGALGAAEPAPWQAQPAPPAAAPADDGTPDWLQSLNAEFTTPADVPQPGEDAPPVAFGSQATPDWLSGMDLSAGAPAFDGQATPDWLSGADPNAGALGEVAPAPAFDNQATPDWLSGIDLGASAPPASEEAFGSAVPAFTDETLPFQQAQPGSSETEYLSAVPDWMAGVSAEEAAPALQGTAEPELGGGLERADLPSWLEAMRPVEAVAPELFKDTSDGRVESAGPLAGLRGALPAEIDISAVRKPAPHSAGAQVKDDFQARLAMLQSILNAETEPKTSQATAAISSQLILRALVFVAFLLAVVWGLWSDPPAASPADSSAGSKTAAAFYNVLDSLPGSAPVLMAIDYAPAYASELEPAASAVLTHLAARNSLVGFISTTPNGPLQARALVEQMNKLRSTSGDETAVYDRIVNLGYLPGGPMGLLAFANQPAQVAPYDIYGKTPWVSGLLDENKALDNFTAVIVATEGAETARLWIEQVGPLLQAQGIPLLFITSAQTEPVIQPYYTASTKQVAGLLSGVQGGQTYQGFIGQPESQALPVAAFQLALLAAIALILVGSLVSLVTYTLAHNPSTPLDTMRKK